MRFFTLQITQCDWCSYKHIKLHLCSDAVSYAFSISDLCLLSSSNLVYEILLWIYKNLNTLDQIISACTGVDLKKQKYLKVKLLYFYLLISDALCRIVADRTVTVLMMWQSSVEIAWSRHQLRCTRWSSKVGFWWSALADD